MTPTEVTEKLGLLKMKDRSWYCHPSNAIDGDGLFEGTCAPDGASGGGTLTPDPLPSPRLDGRPELVVPEHQVAEMSVHVRAHAR